MRKSYQRLVQGTRFCMIKYFPECHSTVPLAVDEDASGETVCEEDSDKQERQYTVWAPAKSLEATDHLLHANIREKCGLVVVEAQKKVLMHSKLKPVLLSLACNKSMQAKNIVWT